MVLTATRFLLYSFALYSFLDFSLQPLSVAASTSFPYALSATILVQALAVGAALSGYAERIIALFIQARPLGSREAARVMPLVNEVQARAGVSNVRVLYSPSSELNAYALGRSTIILNKGLFDKLEPEQIKGIIGHEFGHLRHGDTLRRSIEASISFIPVVVTNCVIWTCDALIRGISAGARLFPFYSASILYLIGLLLALFAWAWIGVPLVVTLIDRRLLGLLERKLSRSDEYRADCFAASVSSPEAMISALEAIEHEAKELPLSFVDRLFTTHPPMAYRIDKLSEMLGEQLETKAAAA